MNKISLISLSLLVPCLFAYNNPVIPDKNVPDPGAILYEGVYYIATTTNFYSDKDKFPIHKSLDLQTWEFVGYAIPESNIPSWIGTINADFWAPEIHVVNGGFRIYYTARSSTGILSIGVAHSESITGPYTDIGSPLIQQQNVGSIDCSILKDEESGKNYLIWKDDGNGNRPQIPTWIWAVELNQDGLGVTGEWHQLIRNDLSWEADLVEGPWVIKRNGWYYLFYSGHSYCDDTYAVGVARSKSALGPYIKKGDPIRKSDSRFAGPGHCSVIKGIETELVMLYHGWVQGKVCGNNNRILLVDNVLWSDDEWPYFNIQEQTSQSCAAFLTA